MKNIMNLVVVFIIISTHLDITQSFTYTDVKTLLNTLFVTNNYTTDIRPTLDHDNPTDVYMDFYLMGINELDVVGQKMVTTAYLELLWEDENLVWDQNTNDIGYIFLPQKKVWKPDLSLLNGFTKIKEFGDDFLLVWIEYGGWVWWRPFEVFETKCTINIKYFPFDRQTCTLEFGAWMMSLEEQDVEVGVNGIMLDEYIKSDEWTLESSSAESVWSAVEGAKVVFSITVKRIPNYYIMNIVLPVLFLSILMIFTFAIPADSGEKMGYSMTVFLSFAVFLTIVSSSFPVTSETSVISAFLVILLSIGTIIVLITGVQLRLHFRPDDRKVPGFLCKFVRISRRIQCRKRQNENEIQKIDILPVIEKKPKLGKNGGKIVKNGQAFDCGVNVMEDVDEQKEITWSDVVASIDFFCFYFFLLAVISITASMFTYAYIVAL